MLQNGCKQCCNILITMDQERAHTTGALPCRTEQPVMTSAILLFLHFYLPVPRPPPFVSSGIGAKGPQRYDPYTLLDPSVGLPPPRPSR
jgi:hypothetical protein